MRFHAFICAILLCSSCADIDNEQVQSPHAPGAPALSQVFEDPFAENVTESPDAAADLLFAFQQAQQRDASPAYAFTNEMGGLRAH